MSRQELSRPPGCGCDPWFLVDSSGNIMELQTCPECIEKALDSMRGVCYNIRTVEGRESVVEYQKDLFVEPRSSKKDPFLELEKEHGP